MKGAIARAQELQAQTPGAWIPQQFETRQHRHPRAHHRPGNRWPISRRAWTRSSLAWARAATPGTARVLKAKFPQLKVFAVEPTASPVISGRRTGNPPHPGHWRGLHPQNLDTSLLDGVIQVDAEGP